MKRWLTFVSVLVIGGMFTSEVFALKTPFSKMEVAACGKNCVQGYWLNLGARETYYAGDASNFNEQIAGLVKAKDEFPAPTFSSKKIILHPGPKTVSRHDDAERHITSDWSVNTWPDVDTARVDSSLLKVHLQIDIWLGGQIKLDELRIPADFEVVSGREIEQFVEARKGMSK